jgi:hypothetical protein
MPAVRHAPRAPATKPVQVRKPRPLAKRAVDFASGERALLQAKLTVSEPGDQLEKEADLVAERVLRMPAREAPSPDVPIGPVQDSVQREAEEEAPEEDDEAGSDAGTMQRACAVCSGDDEDPDDVVQREAMNSADPEDEPVVQRECVDCDDMDTTDPEDEPVVQRECTACDMDDEEEEHEGGIPGLQRRAVSDEEEAFSERRHGHGRPD